MKKQPKQGGTTTHKKNAWWRKPTKTVRQQPYVISEGKVWFGCKVLGGLAWVWLESSEAATKHAANDARFIKVGR